MSIRDRIKSLRELMDARNIDVYIVPSGDNHQSEYIGEHFEARRYISGFTGSAGTVAITKDDAVLWTDGRYFIQAEEQLKDSGIRLFKMGEPNVLSLQEYLEGVLLRNQVLGFDGKVMSAKQGFSLEENLSHKNISIKYDEDLVDIVWKDRPSISKEKAFFLRTIYSGETIESKLFRTREVMKEKNVNNHIISSLDDIAWLLNIRGRDTEYSPLILSYCIVTLDRVHIFVDESKLTDEIKQLFVKHNVDIHPYDDVYEFIKSMNSDSSVMIDTSKINYSILKDIPKDIRKVEMANPTMHFKAKKNHIEIENMKNAHIKDGIAFTKFMYWLKNNIGKIEITEISASDKLTQYRSEQEGFINQSFAPISAYKDHAAMMHYSATEESNYKLEPKDLYLVDTGGNYFEGTTDVTRTIAMGPISDELKLHFTTVLKGMIDLSMAKFLYGCKGFNLDILARQPIWNLGIDYKCGTGHGIGYLLNIHEGPAGFRWSIIPEKNEDAVLESGMIITNEPGIYIQGSHGIRIENELLIKKGNKNEFGTFMEFEPITYIPIDIDAIDISYLNDAQRNYLNNYHEIVYKNIAPHLLEEEKVWLKDYTRKI